MHGTWRIDAVEAPAPKPGDAYADGFEHVECVLYDDMAAFLEKYPGKPFVTKAMDRGVNPEIGLQLGEYSVKFHRPNLPTAVHLEHKLGLHDIRDGQQQSQ